MSKPSTDKIDEVSKYYEPATKLGYVDIWGFWIIASISIYMLYATTLGIISDKLLQPIFIVIVIFYFTISQISRFFLVPRAERMRRKQMLSDAFGTTLCHDKTSLYYNNEYSPSIHRLGANTMENSFFSKEIAAEILYKKRWVTGGYLLVWLFAFSYRHNNLELLTWITQVVFSGQIVVQWLNLEVLRHRHECTYEQLHSHFLHEVGVDSPTAVATVLDSFVAYEAAKSSAGILLSSKVFHKLNPSLTEKWNQIRLDLKMDIQKE